MSKKQLSQKDLKFLQGELHYSSEMGIINGEQAQQILGLYQVKAGFSFIRVLVTIGAVLIGLGILSFIASNWNGISKLSKFVIIIGAYLGANIGGLVLSKANPKTGRAFIYLGALIYGAGIFLIGQMFNLGGHFSIAFLLWGLGIVPMAVILRDKLIYIFATLLIVVYMNGQSFIDSFPYFIIAIVPMAYYLGRFFDYAKPVAFLNNVLTINMVAIIMNQMDVPGGVTALVLFGLGLAMYFVPISYERKLFQLQGTILLGGAGLFLTLPYAWHFMNSNATYGNSIANIVFAIVYLAILFFLTRKGNLISLVFICLTIFRFYTDTMYAFKSKSLFFIIGGMIIMGFGFYFEKLRKEQGGVING